MKKNILFALLFGLSIAGYSQRGVDPKNIMRQVIQAMGGDSLLHTIQTIAYNGYAYRNAIDQSERPDGPFIFEPSAVRVEMDFQHHQLIDFSQSQSFTFVNNDTAFADEHGYFEKNGGVMTPKIQDRLIQDEFNFSPVTLAYTALNSGDLKMNADTVLQKNPQYVLAFTWHRYPVRIFINRYTQLLTAYEVTKPYNDNFLDIWGDSRKLVFYSFWYLEKDGLHYPRQKDIYLNGWHYAAEIITDLKTNAPLDTGSIAITGGMYVSDEDLEQRQREKSWQRISASAKEVKKGIWIIPGFCNATFVEQGDGIVVIEASQSSEYSKLLMQKVHALFPAKKIKAVITTSDAWLHIGGIREFASRHIPIYHLDLNQFIIQKLLSASYLTRPDDWQNQNQKNPILISVNRKLVIGQGMNSLQLIPYRTETGERMMMAYFPSQKLLYASDLYQHKSTDGTYWEPHYPFEVYSAIGKHHLDVELIYAMHLANPISFSELQKDRDKNFQ